MDPLEKFETKMEKEELEVLEGKKEAFYAILTENYQQVSNDIKVLKDTKLPELPTLPTKELTDEIFRLTTEAEIKLNSTQDMFQKLLILQTLIIEKMGPEEWSNSSHKQDFTTCIKTNAKLAASIQGYNNWLYQTEQRLKQEAPNDEEDDENFNETDPSTLTIIQDMIKSQNKNTYIPKINKFTGETYDDYLIFKERWDIVEKDLKALGKDKGELLAILKSKIDNPTAKKILEIFPETEKYYSRALEELDQHFLNKTISINEILRSLLELNKRKIQHNFKSVQDFYFKNRKLWAQMSRIKIKQEDLGEIIFSAILERGLSTKLSEHWTKRVQQLDKKKDDDKKYADNILEVIKTEMSFLERQALNLNTDDTTPQSRSSHQIPKKQNCQLCSKTNHQTPQCRQLKNLTPQQLIDKCKQLKLCTICLYNHNYKECNSKTSCYICKQKHHHLLHKIFNKAHENKPNYNKLGAKTKYSPPQPHPHQHQQQQQQAQQRSTDRYVHPN